MSRTRILLLLCLANIVAAAEAVVVQHVGNGRFRRIPVAVPATDPAGRPDADLLADIERRVKGRQVDALIADLVDRIEARHADAVPAPLADWLADHPAIRHAFYLALDPVYDDAAGAIATLADLVAHDPERTARFHHLAIAMAVVHDHPDAVYSSRLAMIWSVQASQFPPMPDKLAIFDHLTDPAMRQRMPYPPDGLVWPLLVHVVDLDLPQSERDWVTERFQTGKRDLSTSYGMVPYDHGKLKRQPALGSAPYLMRNVLAKGGVCVDQAHFSSRVMKTFGIPAVKVSGEGRFGGSGHAWTGFLEAGRGGARFAFTGRYNIDYYYTGDVFDPQTRRTVLDRTLAMRLDGALHDYPAYVEAGALTRIARAVRATDPDTALLLTEAALERNPFHAEAWRLLAAHLRAGTLEQRAAGRWLNSMARTCRDHPDLTLEILWSVLDTMPEDDLRARDRLYRGIGRLYDERPDLQIALLRRQCAELYAAGEADTATNLAVACLIANADEGALILPLLEVVIRDCAERPADERSRVRAALERMIERFPKQRGSQVSPAWLQMQQLLKRL